MNSWSDFVQKAIQTTIKKVQDEDQEIRMNLPPDIFTGDHFDKYKENIDKIVDNLKSRETFQTTL